MDQQSSAEGNKAEQLGQVFSSKARGNKGLVVGAYGSWFYSHSTPNSTLVRQGGKDMFDSFEKFVYWVTRLFSWVVGELAFGVNRALVIPFRQSNTSPGEQTKITKLHQDENNRMAGCREVVLGYANHLGYIAREVTTCAEIERLIDSGISPQTLADDIQNRITNIPVSFSGTNPV